MFGRKKINAGKECNALAEVLSERYDSGDVMIIMGRLVQNMEALLMVMKEKACHPDEDSYSDALDLFSTAALKLKYPLFLDFAQRICIAGDMDDGSRIRLIKEALEILCSMRVWILSHLH